MAFQLHAPLLEQGPKPLALGPNPTHRSPSRASLTCPLQGTVSIVPIALHCLPSPKRRHREKKTFHQAPFASCWGMPPFWKHTLAASSSTSICKDGCPGTGLSPPVATTLVHQQPLPDPTWILPPEVPPVWWGGNEPLPAAQPREPRLSSLHSSGHPPSLPG